MLLVFDCMWDDFVDDGQAEFRHYAKVARGKVRLLVMDQRYLEQCSRKDIDLVLWTDDALRTFYDEVMDNRPYDEDEALQDMGECEYCGGPLGYLHTSHWNEEIQNVVRSYIPRQYGCTRCGRTPGDDEG
jgi:uncharacterized protein with PIN domain